LLSLSACSLGNAKEEAALPSATKLTTQPVRALAQTGRAAFPPAQAVASPAPFLVLNEGTPAASQASLKPSPDELTAIEVVKALTPSVVQIFTKIIAMDAFNQPGGWQLA